MQNSIARIFTKDFSVCYNYEKIKTSWIEFNS